MIADQHIDQLDQRKRTWLETMLNAMPIAASCSTLDDQKIIFANKKFTTLFGYELGDHETVREWIEKTYVNPKQAERAEKMWEQYFETPSIVPLKFGPVEVDIRCKDGGVKTVLLSVIVMLKENWSMATFTDITERKEREKRTQKQALEDELTGLPNRRAFNGALKQYLARSRRQKKSTGLLLIDLDEFKPLNDSRGHKAGDAALKIIAERLQLCIRLEDFVARIGGDEFAVLLDNVDSVDAPPEVAERILAAVREPVIVQGKEEPLNASIGVGVYPQDARDGDKLFKIADDALYRAKEKGRGRWSK